MKIKTLVKSVFIVKIIKLSEQKFAIRYVLGFSAESEGVLQKE